MWGSDVLDVAIAIIFVFLLVSILASAIREAIEGFLKTRSTHLEAGIRELLQDQDGTGLVKDLFDHPLIFNLYAGVYKPLKISKWWPTSLTRGRNLPTYIPSRNFAQALMDLAARGPVSSTNSTLASSRPITLQTIRANLSLLQNPPVQRAVLSALDSAQGDLQKAQANIEAWYDSTMDRVSGWYKRSTQWILLAIGLTIAVALNVNTITIGNYLYLNKTAREAVVARAQAAADADSKDKDAQAKDFTYQKAQKTLDELSLPIGGSERWQDTKTKTFPTLGGWLLTGIAASFGAPFWFDLLNKFMVVRSTVKPHQKSPEESSEDSQDASKPSNTAAPPASTAIPLTGTQPSSSAADQDDGCGLPVTSPPSDEDLPVAVGGVS